MFTPLLLTSLVLGAWGGPSCEPVGPLPTLPYEWKANPGSPWHGLFHNGTQVGAWSETTDTYRPYDAGTDTWGPAESRPEAAPVPSRARPADSVTNFGVDISRLNTRPHEEYRLNGAAVTRAAAFTALEGGTLADDSARLRLTIIGTDGERRQVRHDLETAPELAEFRDRLLVQDYAPDNWAVARAGFVTGGTPTLYLQQPGGQVLHRQDEYTGPADLARALRRADPHYDPKKDPDWRKSSVPDLPLLRLPAAVWLLALVFLLVLLRKGLS